MCESFNNVQRSHMNDINRFIIIHRSWQVLLSFDPY